MSQYVKVISTGQYYPTICNGDPDNYQRFGCSPANWTPNSPPILNKYYTIVNESTHPRSKYTILYTIEDNHGQRFVIGAAGLQFSNSSTPTVNLHSRYLASVDPYEGIIREESQENSNNEMNDNIKVGDLVIVKKPGDGHDGELMKITHLKVYNYDYVVCYPHQNVAQYGYNKGQVVKYIPEPELPEDQKPAFSRSELIEILEQNKPAEEILLDIRDHITN